MNIKFIIATVFLAVFVTSCGPAVDTKLQLAELNQEQATRSDQYQLNQSIAWKKHIVFVVNDENTDPTNEIINGENHFKFNTTNMTIEETSTDGNAYIVIHQDFEGGAAISYTFIVPPGESDKYLHLYKIGS